MPAIFAYNDWSETMRIGIDLDDTIISTKEQYKKYQPQYLKQNNISEEELWNNKNYRIDYIKKNIELIFSDVKLKTNALEIINKLIEEGHTIYILTARNSDYHSDIYLFTKKNIERLKIPYNKLILTEKYKLEACIENKIDIMIDNSMYIYDELYGKIKTILYDENNENIDVENRCNSWNDLYNMIKKIG